MAPRTAASRCGPEHDRERDADHEATEHQGQHHREQQLAVVALFAETGLWDGIDAARDVRRLEALRPRDLGTRRVVLDGIWRQAAPRGGFGPLLGSFGVVAHRSILP